MLTAAMSATTTATTTENMLSLLTSQEKRRSRWLYPSQESKKKVVNNGGEEPVWSYRNEAIEGEALEATITCIDFDETGDRLAVGDRAGRISLFRSSSAQNYYSFEAQFKSHDPEFDYLKSLEIEEKINKLRFLKYRTEHQPAILTTNDKTIKLWRINPESKVHMVERYGGLRLPRLSTTGIKAQASQRKVYAGAHAYHINAISPCADGETFLSADDLRINVWHFDISEQTFNIIDLKPTNMEDLTEVITTACFHPTLSYLYMFASSKGLIKLYDLRDSARCQRAATTLTCLEKDQSVIRTRNSIHPSPTSHDSEISSSSSSSSEDEEYDDISSAAAAAPSSINGTNSIAYGQRSFFSEIVASISDARFLDQQSIDPAQLIVARDYLSIKLWDTRKPNSPLSIIPVHDQLEQRLSELYDSDRIFDKFELAPLPGHRLVSGSYSNLISVFDPSAKEEAFRHDLILPGGASFFENKNNHNHNNTRPNLDQRCLHTASHPTRPVLAAASQDSLHIYDLGLLPGASSNKRPDLNHEIPTLPQQSSFISQAASSLNASSNNSSADISYF